MFVFFCMCTVTQYRGNITILHSEFCFYQMLQYIWLGLLSLFQPTKPHVSWKVNKSVTNVTWNLLSNLNLCYWEKCINLLNHLWHQYNSVSLLCYIIAGSSLWSLYANSVILLTIIMWFFLYFFGKTFRRRQLCLHIPSSSPISCIYDYSNSVRDVFSIEI